VVACLACNRLLLVPHGALTQACAQAASLAACANDAYKRFLAMPTCSAQVLLHRPTLLRRHSSVCACVVSGIRGRRGRGSLSPPLPCSRPCSLPRTLPLPGITAHAARQDATTSDVVAVNDAWDCELSLLRNDCRCYCQVLAAALVE